MLYLLHAWANFPNLEVGSWAKSYSLTLASRGSKTPLLPLPTPGGECGPPVQPTLPQHFNFTLVQLVSVIFILAVRHRSQIVDFSISCYRLCDSDWQPVYIACQIIEHDLTTTKITHDSVFFPFLSALFTICSSADSSSACVYLICYALIYRHLVITSVNAVA